ncbi:hypothetical protein [Bosea sp. RCC_152_1]|uniref:hypothetical protein n=1 Tax=Bosea sp. RCC_152_1 TaxID=3239228 RepID=UPI0035239624
MQADAALGLTALQLSNERRKGLRVALAVAVGFARTVHSGGVIPYLGPFFAAKYLMGSSLPMSPKKSLAIMIIVLVVGALLQLIVGVAGHRPAVLLLVLGLVYFVCFFLQAKGKAGPAIFLILVVSIMVPLLAILNRDLASSILSILFQGVLSGTLLMWMAHLVIPHRGPEDTEVPRRRSTPTRSAMPRPTPSSS